MPRSLLAFALSLFLVRLADGSMGASLARDSRLNFIKKDVSIPFYWFLV
jgi:hypothetical protein